MVKIEAYDPFCMSFEIKLVLDIQSLEVTKKVANFPEVTDLYKV